MGTFLHILKAAREFFMDWRNGGRGNRFMDPFRGFKVGGNLEDSQGFSGDADTFLLMVQCCQGNRGRLSEICFSGEILVVVIIRFILRFLKDGLGFFGTPPTFKLTSKIILSLRFIGLS